MANTYGAGLGITSTYTGKLKKEEEEKKKKQRQQQAVRREKIAEKNKGKSYKLGSGYIDRPQERKTGSGRTVGQTYNHLQMVNPKAQQDKETRQNKTYTVQTRKGTDPVTNQERRVDQLETKLKNFDQESRQIATQQKAGSYSRAFDQKNWGKTQQNNTVAQRNEERKKLQEQISAETDKYVQIKKDYQEKLSTRADDILRKNPDMANEWAAKGEKIIREKYQKELDDMFKANSPDYDWWTWRELQYNIEDTAQAWQDDLTNGQMTDPNYKGNQELWNIYQQAKKDFEEYDKKTRLSTYADDKGLLKKLFTMAGTPGANVEAAIQQIRKEINATASGDIDRQTEEMFSYKNYPKEYEGLIRLSNAVIQVMDSLTGIPDSMYSMALTVRDTFTNAGKDISQRKFEEDPNSGKFSHARVLENMRYYYTEDIDPTTAFFMNMGVEGAKMILGSVAWGGSVMPKPGAFAAREGSLYTKMMGVQVGEMTAYESAKRGASPEQAGIASMAAGIAAWLVEELSLGNIAKAYSSMGKPTLRALFGLAKTAAINEGMEEVTEEAIDIGTDLLVMGDKSEIVNYINEYIAANPDKAQAEIDTEVAFYLMSRLGQAGAGGALLGGMLGGAGAIQTNPITMLFETRAHHEEVAKRGGQIRAGVASEGIPGISVAPGYEKVDEGWGLSSDEVSLRKDAAQQPEGTRARKILDEIVEKEQRGEEVTDYDIGRLEEEVNKSKATKNEVDAAFQGQVTKENLTDDAKRMLYDPRNAGFIREEYLVNVDENMTPQEMKAVIDPALDSQVEARETDIQARFILQNGLKLENASENTQQKLLSGELFARLGIEQKIGETPQQTVERIREENREMYKMHRYDYFGDEIIRPDLKSVYAGIEKAEGKEIIIADLGPLQDGLETPDAIILSYRIAGKEEGATFALSHEATHGLEQTKHYGDVKQAAIDYYNKNNVSGGWDAAVGKIFAGYNKMGISTSIEGAEAEVVANFVGQNLFGNYEQLKNFVESRRSAATRLMAWLKSKFDSDYDSAILRRAYANFVKAFNEVDTSAEAKQKQTIYQYKLNNGSGQFSIKYNADGTPFVDIDKTLTAKDLKGTGLGEEYIGKRLTDIPEDLMTTIEREGRETKVTAREVVVMNFLDTLPSEFEVIGNKRDIITFTRKHPNYPSFPTSEGKMLEYGRDRNPNFNNNQFVNLRLPFMMQLDEIIKASKQVEDKGYSEDYKPEKHKEFSENGFTYRRAFVRMDGEVYTALYSYASGKNALGTDTKALYHLKIQKASKSQTKLFGQASVNIDVNGEEASTWVDQWIDGFLNTPKDHPTRPTNLDMETAIAVEQAALNSVIRDGLDERLEENKAEIRAIREGKIEIEEAKAHIEKLEKENMNLEFDSAFFNTEAQEISRLFSGTDEHQRAIREYMSTCENYYKAALNGEEWEQKSFTATAWAGQKKDESKPFERRDNNGNIAISIDKVPKSQSEVNKRNNRDIRFYTVFNKKILSTGAYDHFVAVNGIPPINTIEGWSDAGYEPVGELKPETYLELWQKIDGTIDAWGKKTVPVYRGNQFKKISPDNISKDDLKGVTVQNIKTVNKEDFDETWAIVRSLKSNPKNLQHVIDLSPSDALLRDYLSWAKNNQWNEKTFVEKYRLRFIEEIKSNPDAIAKLQELVAKSRQGKKIALCCFCDDENLCHRKLIMELLNAMVTSEDGLTIPEEIPHQKYVQGRENIENPDDAVFFTGHRAMALPIDEMKRRFRIEIENAIKDGKTTFISGMAMGADLIAAETVIEMKKDYPDIKLVAAVPFQKQPNRWSEGWRFKYSQLLRAADEVHMLNSKYVKNAFDIRDKWMVDNASYGISYFENRPSGTKNTIDYANKKGKNVTNIAGYGKYRTLYDLDNDTKPNAEASSIFDGLIPGVKNSSNENQMLGQAAMKFSKVDWRFEDLIVDDLPEGYRDFKGSPKELQWELKAAKEKAEILFTNATAAWDNVDKIIGGTMVSDAANFAKSAKQAADFSIGKDTTGQQAYQSDYLGREIWVEARDRKGQIIFETDKNGETKPKMVRCKSLMDIWAPVYEAMKTQPDYKKKFQMFLRLADELDRIKMYHGTIPADALGLDWGFYAETGIKHYKKVQMMESELRKKSIELIQEHPEFADIAQEVWQYNLNNLKYLYDTQVISKEDYEKILKAHPHYVPAYRVKDRQGGEPTMNVRPIKASYGHHLEDTFIPIDQAMADQTRRYRIGGARNAMCNALATAYDGNSYDMGEYVTELKTEQPKPKVKMLPEKAGVTEEDIMRQIEQMLSDEGIPTSTSQEKGKIVFYRNGLKSYMSVSNNIYMGYTSLFKGMTKTEEVFGKPTRALGTFFRNFVTNYNPTFIATNFLKDLGDAVFYSQNMGKFLKNFPKAWKQIMSNGQIWQLYKAVGGFNSSFLELDLNLNRGRNAFQRVFLDKIEKANLYVEQAPRLAEFISTLEANEMLDENGNLKNENLNYDVIRKALHDANDITVNFGQSGLVTRVLNRSAVPFLNASVQGAVKFAKQFERQGGKAWANLAIKAAILGFLPGLLNSLLYKDDEEFKHMKDWVRDNNYMFKLSDGKWITIPRGRLMSFFAGLGNRTVRAANGDNVDWESLGEVFENNIAPQSVTSANIISPILRAINNKTWDGRDIDSWEEMKKRPEERYDNSTSFIFRALGDFLKVSPKRLQVLFEDYSGFIGDVVVPETNEKPDHFWDSMLNRFVKDVAYSNDYGATFRAYKDEIQQQVDYEGYSEVPSILKHQLNYLDSQNEPISKLYDLIEELERSDMDEYKKEEQIRAARLAISETYAVAYANAESVKKTIEKYYKIDENAPVSIQKRQSYDAYYRAINEVFGAEYALKQIGLEDKDLEDLDKRGIKKEDYIKFYFATHSGDKYYTPDENGNAQSYSNKEKAGMLVDLFGKDEKTIAAIYQRDLESENVSDRNSLKFAMSVGVKPSSYIKRELQKENEEGDKSGEQKVDYYYQNGKMVPVYSEGYVSGSKLIKATHSMLNSGYTDKEIEYFYQKEYGDDDKFVYARMAGVSARDYVRYRELTATIQPDYDENGKAIKDSKKMKIFEAINSMNIPKIEKMMLFMRTNALTKEQYREVFDHINSLNISAAEKLQIAQGLGFKVENGMVYMRKAS